MYIFHINYQYILLQVNYFIFEFYIIELVDEKQWIFKRNVIILKYYLYDGYPIMDT